MVKRIPGTERGEQRREQILHTALQLFARQGIEGTGLRQIAQEVGIAQPALYHYFASKDDLVEAVIAWRAEVLAARFAEAAPGQPAPASLRQGLIGYLERFHENWADPDNLAIHQVMLSELSRPTAVAERLRRLFIQPQLDRLAGLFANLASAGKIRDLSPDLLAVQFIGPLLLAAFALGTAGEAAALRQLVYQHLEVFIRGVEPR